MDILRDVMDPEVPVISVVELGIIRGIDIEGDAITVTVTPTYSGCPAMHAIEGDIVAALQARGAGMVVVRTSYSPAWTTDWIPAEAREKLRAYGIAPPGAVDHSAPVAIGRRRATVRCPFCGSMDTELRSEFGSTACKAIHVCGGCHQPFEEFKPI
ncbi:MAG TPA: 1,2-phenylacetyl-CoA epoxidase subunit PaaD [Gemmatimonadaceae bacterium]|nr:1,2-phenylacetyl-CoA epoxidase subunit PaaD [Gemmatimonadaceae bacterium]